MGLFHFLHTAPKYLHFSHKEINCESSSIFFYLTDLCLVKAMWGMRFDFLVQGISVFTIITGMILKYYCELHVFKIQVT